MPVVTARQVPDLAAVGKNRLLMHQQDIRIVQRHMHCAMRQGCAIHLPERLRAQEVTPGVQVDREGQTGTEGIIRSTDVVSEVSISLLQAQRIHREEAGCLHAEILTGFPEALVDVDG